MTTINRKLNTQIRQAQTAFNIKIFRYNERPTDENRIACALAQAACYEAIQNLAEDKPFNKYFWTYSIELQKGCDKRYWIALNRHETYC